MVQPTRTYVITEQKLQRLISSKLSFFSSAILSELWVSVILLASCHGKNDGSSKENLSLHPADFLAPHIGLHILACPGQTQSLAKEIE